MLLPLNKKKGEDIIIIIITITITMKGEDIVLRTKRQKQVDQLYVWAPAANNDLTKWPKYDPHRS